MLHDVIVTSYMESLYLVWCVWKEETHIYVMIPHKHTLVIIFGFLRRVVITSHPRGKRCYKKGLVG